MALSCYSSSNWEHLNLFAADHHGDDGHGIRPDEAEYLADVLGLNLNNSCYESLAFSDSYYVDPFLVASSGDFFFNPENYVNSYSSLYPIFPENDLELYSCTKRQKGCEGYYVNSSSSVSEVDNGMLPSFCNSIGFVPNPPALPEPEIFPPFGGPSLASNINPPAFITGSNGGGGSEMMNVPNKGGSGSSSSSSNGSGGTLSSQSIAARQRRRKITEKTQELGKLVPGGQKMNTAEMFQAAFKYIKFLQAQVGILESLASPVDQESWESFQCEELNSLLESCLIQERLYSMGKCLVPQKFVHYIAKDNCITSNLPN